MVSEPTDLGPSVVAGESTDDLATDATNLARGSGIVFLGGIFARALRWVVGWALSWLLGPAGLGLYKTAVNVVSTITAFSPLGLDTGVVFFVSRYRSSGERERLKGTLLLGVVISLVMGVFGGLGLFVAATWGPWWEVDSPVRGALRLIAPAIALWTPLLFFVGSLKAVKDMRRNALAYQVVLPAVLLAGMLVLVGLLDWGVSGAIGAFLCANAVALVVAARFAWFHFGPILRDRTIHPQLEPRRLLWFSIPQSLTAAAFQLNLYMDVLMLAALAGMEDVGFYFVAVSLASIGSVPANAIVAMFNPVIAELVYAGETRRLNSLLKVVTRWLIVVALPGYLLLFIVPDAVLLIYDEAYEVVAWPLMILVAGQVINTACAPTMRLIPMSGHAMLNLANGVVALALNIGLNYLLIPQYGMLGAAIATGSTLALWSLWRVGEVWLLLKCFPFDWRTGGLVALGISGATAIALTFDAILPRLAGAVVLDVVFLAVAWFFVRTAEDDVVLAKIKGRVLRLVGR